MDEETLQFWRNIAIRMMEQVEKAISPLIGKPEAGTVVQIGADGTPSKLIDLIAEDEVITVVYQENLQEVIEEEKEPLFYLDDYQRQVAEKIVMGESEGEPYDGQILVAQCILNACLKDGLQPSEVRYKYQYSGWNEEPSESVKEAVRAVFDDGYKVVDDFILYFYAPKYASGKWHETQKFIIEVGGHRFFAEWDE